MSENSHLHSDWKPLDINLDLDQIMNINRAGRAQTQGASMSASLPNFNNAVLDIRKLNDYCLNPFHPKGKDKARVFRAALGLTQRDAVWLRGEILQNLGYAPATRQTEDQYGVRYEVNIKITKQNMSAILSTVWMIAHNDVRPTLITCRIL